jgi:hypothetical protein
VPYWRENNGKDLQVFLTYTNASLLQFMQVHITEEDPPLIAAVPGEDEEAINPRRIPRRRWRYAAI